MNFTLCAHALRGPFTSFPPLDPPNDPVRQARMRFASPFCRQVAQGTVRKSDFQSKWQSEMDPNTFSFCPTGSFERRRASQKHIIYLLHYGYYNSIYNIYYITIYIIILITHIITYSRYKTYSKMREVQFFNIYTPELPPPRSWCRTFPALAPKASSSS